MQIKTSSDILDAAALGRLKVKVQELWESYSDQRRISDELQLEWAEANKLLKHEEMRLELWHEFQQEKESDK